MIPSMPSTKVINSENSIFSAMSTKGNKEKKDFFFGMVASSILSSAADKKATVKRTDGEGGSIAGPTVFSPVEISNKSTWLAATTKHENPPISPLLKGGKGGFSYKLGEVSDSMFHRADGKNSTLFAMHSGKSIKRDIANLLKSHGVEESKLEKILLRMEDVKFSPKLGSDKSDIVKTGILKAPVNVTGNKKSLPSVMYNWKTMEKDVADLLKGCGVRDEEAEEILSAMKKGAFLPKMESKKSADEKKGRAAKSAGPPAGKKNLEVLGFKESKLEAAANKPPWLAATAKHEILSEWAGWALASRHKEIRGQALTPDIFSRPGSTAEIGMKGQMSGHDPIRPSLLINQITDGAGNIFKKGSGRVKIQLNPPRLGTVNIDVSVHNDKVKMVLMTDTHEVRHVLQHNVEQLRNSLQGHGLHVDSFDVLVQERSDRGGPGFRHGATLSGEDRDKRDSGMEERMEEDAQLQNMSSIDENGAGHISVRV